MNDKANKTDRDATKGDKNNKGDKKKDGKKKKQPAVSSQPPKNPTEEKTAGEPAAAMGSVKPSSAANSRPATNAKPQPKKNLGPAAQPGRKTSWTAVLALIVSFGTLGAGGFAFYQLENNFRHQGENQALQLNQQSEHLGQQDVQLKQQDTYLKQQDEKFVQLRQSQQSTETTLADEVRARQSAQDEHQALSVAMSTLSEKMGRTSQAWRLAEVEYLLTIANHRLTLAHDIDTAIAVFETADGRLKAMGDPALLSVRNMISQEVISLRSLPQPDIAGMALEVGNLALQINEMPLVDKKRVAIATGGSRHLEEVVDWKDIPQAVWQDLKGLVTVQRHQQPIEPLLPPNESWFLQQNLRLKLEQARLALLRTDTALFHQYLAEAKTWITTFFDAESSVVANLKNSLSRLEGEELSTTIPDVSGSLKALRQRLNSQEWSTTGSAPPPKISSSSLPTPAAS